MNIPSLLKLVRIVDAHDGQLSLTNAALIATLTRLSVTPAIAWADVAAFFLALAAYQTKKLLVRWDESQRAKAQASEAGQNLEATTAEVRRLADEVGKLQLAAGWARKQ